jgi:hypothetical protein
MKQKILISLVTGVGAAAVLSVLFMLGNSDAVTSASDNDPSTAVVPTLDFDDPAKSMVVRLDFNSRTDVDLSSAIVSHESSRARIGDPPLLIVQLFDDEGVPIDEFNAWHPLWKFEEGPSGEERRVVLSEGEGKIVFPFDPNLGSMEVKDNALNEDLITVDLKPAIRSFCEENPDDPDCEISDLAIQNVQAVNPPGLILVGQSDSLVIRTTMTNKGPDAPTDAVLTVNVNVPSGVSVTPVNVVQNEAAIALNELRDYDKTYSVACSVPGKHLITFASTIDAKEAATSDPNPSNNVFSKEVTIDCAVPVTINIQPGGDPNSNQLKSNGVIPLAVLSTKAGEYGNPLAFDATKIDPLSVKFGNANLVKNNIGGASEYHGKGHIENSFELDEKTKDGDKDMVLHFDMKKTGLTTGDTQACIRGEFVKDGNLYTFYGCGSVRIIT